jgi:hypothetical protein
VYFIVATFQPKFQLKDLKKIGSSDETESTVKPENSLNRSNSDIPGESVIVQIHEPMPSPPESEDDEDDEEEDDESKSTSSKEESSHSESRSEGKQKQSGESD